MHDLVLAYIQFCAFEFGILLLLLRPVDAPSKQALCLLAVLLLLLPLIRIGPSNDWMLRISTPCLVMLLILTLRELDRPIGKLLAKPRTAGLLTVLVLGSITPGFEVARALHWSRTPPNYAQTLVEQQGGYHPPHYIGLLNLAQLARLFRQPQPVPSGPARSYR